MKKHGTNKHRHAHAQIALYQAFCKSRFRKVSGKRSQCQHCYDSNHSLDSVCFFFPVVAKIRATLLLFEGVGTDLSNPKLMQSGRQNAKTKIPL